MPLAKTVYISCSWNMGLNKDNNVSKCEHEFIDTNNHSSKLTRGSLTTDTIQRCSKCGQERIKRETDERNY